MCGVSENQYLSCCFVKMMGSAASSRAMTPVPGQQQEGFSVQLFAGSSLHFRPDKQLNNLLKNYWNRL
jgi:hypothetical protein